MPRFSAFLQTLDHASVTGMFAFPICIFSVRRTPARSSADGHTPWPQSDRQPIEAPCHYGKVTPRKHGVLCQPLAFLAPVLLAACGFNGTDPDEGDTQAADQQAAAPADPDLASFEQVDLADSEPRPQMQLQVVLDQRGFGPGVIDGKEGISTANALKGFQEANGLDVTGELDDTTREALAQWRNVPATRVVRIPESWGQLDYQEVPE